MREVAVKQCSVIRMERDRHRRILIETDGPLKELPGPFGNRSQSARSIRCFVVKTSTQSSLWRALWESVSGSIRICGGRQSEEGLLLETVANYLEAIEEINLAERELEALVQTVIKAGSTLATDWATLSVQGVDNPLSPDVPAGLRRRVIKPAQWPTIEKIAQVLSQMHKAHEAAEAAWKNVTPKLRARLSPPPERFTKNDLAAGKSGPRVRVSASLPRQPSHPAS
jgi:hypothetical protein